MIAYMGRCTQARAIIKFYYIFRCFGSGVFSAIVIYKLVGRWYTLILLQFDQFFFSSFNDINERRTKPHQIGKTHIHKQPTKQKQKCIFPNIAAADRRTPSTTAAISISFHSSSECSALGEQFEWTENGN